MIDLTMLPLWMRALYYLPPLCTTALFTAIFINFAQAQYDGRVKTVRRSVVATASMTLFFVGIYLLIHHRIGMYPLKSWDLMAAVTVPGAVLLVVGTAVNLLGRLRLGRNWANQATVYTDHRLVTGGVYGVVRHPLYASLIWIFLGAGLLYLNYLVLLATLVVFLPMMTYRARLEETLLCRQFPEYPAYRQRVGMFFPRLRRGDPHESL